MKLASIERISEVKAHWNAHSLDLVKVLGFQLVTQKGLHKEGDLVGYVQTDTLLPDTEWALDYKKYSPDRVRAVSLRDEYSEGILLSLTQLNEINNTIEYTEGLDITDILGITKYVYPEPQDPDAKTPKLPYFLSPTDESRWENILSELPFGEKVDIFLKVDGTSATYIKNIDGESTNEFHICARGQEMLLDRDNKYTYIAKKHNLNDKLNTYINFHGLLNVALRGEIYGEGSSRGKRNPHNGLKPDIAFFSFYNVKERRYYKKGEDHYFLNVCNYLNLPTVPLIEKDVILTQELIDHYSKDIKTLFDKPFEGVVIQHSKGSFKIINKAYDTKK